MKKILTFFICIIATGNVWAGWGEKGNCLYDWNTRYVKVIFDCGDVGDSTNCGNHKRKNADKVHTYKSGDCISYDAVDGGGGHKNFCCCSGTWKNKSPDSNVYGVTHIGKSIKSSDSNGSSVWYTKTENVEVDLSETHGAGAICTYTKKLNMCGTEISKPCTIPTACSGNAVLRNGACVPPCPDGQAWESETSNTCVECPTTNHMGIITNNTNCKDAKERQEAIEAELEELKAPETLRKFREWGAGTKTAMTDTETKKLQEAFGKIPSSFKKNITTPDEHFREIATPSCQVALQGFDNKICKKCTEGQEFFIPEEEDPNSESEEDNTDTKIKETTGICVKKSRTKAVSPEVLRKCGLCDDLDTTQGCLKCYAENGANSNNCSEYKAKCLITY